MAVNVAKLIQVIALVYFLLFIHDTSSSFDDTIATQTGIGTQHVFAQAEKPFRYLIYDVNPGEGFNLRRDVYMRIANLVKGLNEEEVWILVLPAWERMYHWQSKDIGSQNQIPWSNFFDLSSLNKHVPVMEFEDFLHSLPERVIDEVYHLQRYKEDWTEWSEKMDIAECIDKWNGFQKVANDSYVGRFFGFGDVEDIVIKKFHCLSIQGHASFIKPFLIHNTTGRSVFLNRAETLLHDRFGNALYWEARRSMVFAKHLREIADDYREKYLDSTDAKDKTVMDPDWTKNVKRYGDAKGGPYIGVHLRRKDYIRAHKKQVPSLKYAAEQIEKILEKHKLKKVFIATDAPTEEFSELKSYLKKYKVFRFEPTKEIKKKYKDGGMAIIDQWIVAHSRYFIGTYVSTFSFRIQEEREILGFEPENTFNAFCGDEDEECEQPSKWKIVF